MVTQPPRAEHAMVVSGEANATDVGLATLNGGGNAIDAAVAMSFCLSVTHSGMCGLGGGGYLLVRMSDGRTEFLDFRERAPRKASAEVFNASEGTLCKENMTTWLTVAVPGHVRGLELAHKRFGTKPWEELLQPAIELAANGHSVSYLRAQSMRVSAKLAQDPESKRIFQRNGRCYEVNETLIQPELANALGRVAMQGSTDFYSGETAQMLSAAMTNQGGLLTLEDLKDYVVVPQKPLAGRYRDYELITASGSSAGGIALLQMLGVLAGSGYERSGSAGSGAVVHYMTETMRRVFADCSQHVGDPEFVTTPVTALLSADHLAALRASIDAARATPSRETLPSQFSALGSGDTTHFSVLDASGNAVAVTCSLNSEYGSGITVPGLGFLLNSHMDNFAAQPGSPNPYGLALGGANALQPRKRPISFMTPTIALLDGKLFMVIGTPGGPTIPNSLLQTIVNVVDFRMPAVDAVSMPRFHHQWLPDKLRMEPGFSSVTMRVLTELGHEIEIGDSNNDMNMILIDDNGIHGVIDPRREGKGAGH